MTPELVCRALGAGLGALLVVWLVERVAWRASATLRHLLWRLALVGFWLVPVVVIALARWQVQPLTVQVPILPPSSTAQLPGADDARAEGVALEAAEPRGVRGSAVAVEETAVARPSPVLAEPPPVTDPSPAVAGSPQPPAHDWRVERWHWLLGLWLLGALVGLAGFVRDVHVARRLREGSRPMADAGLLALIARRGGEMGLRRPPLAVESGRVNVPTVLGWPRADLLAPQGFGPAGRGAEAAIVHELAHIRRGDVAVQVAARLTRVLCWWHPLAWVMSARLAATAEEACDDWALALTGGRQEYAAALVTFATASGAAAGLGCTGRGKALVARVRRILACRHVPMVRLTWRTRALLVAGALAAVVSVSLIRMRAVTAEPNDGAPPGSRTVSGSLLTDDGAPIVGAEVELTYGTMRAAAAGGQQAGEAQGVSHAVTDAQGAFTLSLTPGETRASFVIRAPGYEALHGYLWPDDQAIDLRPGKPVPASGRLTCPEPAEVAGREVRLYGWARSEGSVRARGRPSAPVPGGLHVSARTKADESGRFAFKGLPPGDYTLQVSLGKTGRWQPRGTREFSIASGAEEFDLSVALLRAWPVVGRVIDARTEKPVAGAKVTARHSGRQHQQEMTATTHESGGYLLYVLPGWAYEVSYQAPEGYIRVGPVAYTVAVAAGRTATVPTFRCKPGITVTGMVVDEQGRPVPGASVWEEGRDRFQAQPRVRSDESGRFTIPNLPAGSPLTLYASHGDTVTAQVTQVVVGKQRGPVRLVLSSKAASFIRGRVVDQTSAPVPAAEARVLRKIQHWTGPYSSATTDAQGDFRSSVLIPGYSYTVIVRAAGYVPAPPRELRSEAGRTHDLGTLTLVRARGALTGVVVDTAGVPVPQATVYNVGDGPQRVATVTDDRGRFRLTGLLEGPAYAFIQGPGYRFTGVLAATGADDVRIVLPSAAAPRPDRPAAPPAFTEEQYREFAARAAAEGLKLTARTKSHYRTGLMASLIRANPRAGLKAWEAAGWPDHDHVLVTLVTALAQSSPDEALYYASRVDDPASQAAAYREAGVLLAKARADLAAKAFRSAIAAARHVTDRGDAASSLAGTAYEMSKLGLAEAGPLLDEARRAARGLPHDQSGWAYRASIAEATCTRNLTAALGLLGRVPPEYGSQASWALRTIAYRTARRDAAAAEDVLARIHEPWARGEATSRVAYAIARRDVGRALRLARGLDNYGQRAFALGNVAVAIAPRDREQAFDLIEEAVAAAEEPNRGQTYGWFGFGTTIAHLARLALEAGYPDMQGLVARAMSDREPWDRPEYYGISDWPGTDTELGAGLSWVDAPAARHATVAALRRMEHAGRTGSYGMDTVFRAAAVIDPEWALGLVGKLPADGPEDAPSGRLSRAGAYAEIARVLSQTRADRTRESGHGSFWMPDPEQD